MTAVDPSDCVYADLLFFASAFLSEPTGELWKSLVDDAAELGNLADSIDDALAASSRGLAAVLATTDREAFVREHTRLFEAGVLCPVNESAYVRRDKGAILGDIAGFYRAFGCEMDGTSRGGVDHLAAESEFLAALILMRAGALAEGTPEAAHTVTEAMDAFAFDHLGDWMEPFCERLRATADLPAYAAFADWLESVWRATVLRYNLPVGPVESVGPEDDPGTPYECGMAADDNLSPDVSPVTFLRDV